MIILYQIAIFGILTLLVLYKIRANPLGPKLLFSVVLPVWIVIFAFEGVLYFFMHR